MHDHLQPALESLTDFACVLGEGPLWVPGESALYWVDIKGRALYRLSWPDRTLSRWTPPMRICSLAPRAQGGFVAGTDRGFAFIDPAKDIWQFLGETEPDRPQNRFNDGKIDREGRFWAGTMEDAETGLTSGALYRLGADLHPQRMDDGYRVPNGPAFSPDGRRLYHSDSALGQTYVFDLDPGGQAHNKRLFASFSEEQGYPDGMTVDAEGCVWIAYWDGWCVRRLSPSGEILQTVEVPVQRPTSCAFGGPDLDYLFITSAAIGLDEKALAMQPLAGRVFVTKPGARGIDDPPFPG